MGHHVAMLLRRLLFVAAYASVAAAAWHPGMPKAWDSVPSKIADFPYDAQRKAFVIDPWSYRDRLGAYKTLLSSAAALHFGEGGFGDPLWGLPLQFAWQHDTGRLLSPSTAPDRINALSWWGGMNYMLSIVPVIGALEAGVIEVPIGSTVQFASPPNDCGGGGGGGDGCSSRFCTSYTGCQALVPKATKGWTDFMRQVQAAANQTGGSSALSLNESIRLLWTGHVASLHEGLPLMAPLLDNLPSTTEAQFGVAWANLVDFIAALQYDVNYNQTNYLQGMIVPPRVLTASDHAPHIPDFTHAQNRALVVASLFDKANRASKGELLRLFTRGCCTQMGRDDAYNSMISLLEGKALLTIEGIIQFVLDLVKSHPCS